ncbi:MAG: YaaR family protein [Spirochaetales bacterium]|nr:YaaR family protein [Spirochaetales bacterium]
MEKIDNLGNKFTFRRSEKKKKSESPPVKKKDFSELLNPIKESDETVFHPREEEEERQTLEDMLDDIYEEGDKLKKAPTFAHIKSYRNSVKRFLKYITDHMVGVEEKVSGINILKRKRFTLISVIDQKLENLAAEVLSTQHEQCAILKKVDEINGLLVDLVR